MYTAFKQYLLKLNLSLVSRKLYLADVAHFLSSLGDNPTLTQLSLPSTYLKYLDSLKATSVAPSLAKRTSSSLRQFGIFLSQTYSIPNPLRSLPTHTPQPTLNSLSAVHFDYIKHFTEYLKTIHLSPSTIKSYKSDVSRYLDWVTKHNPSTKVSQLLSSKNRQNYLQYLSQYAGGLDSTIERKSKSLTRFKAWYQELYSPSIVPDNNEKSVLPSILPHSAHLGSETSSAHTTIPDKSLVNVKTFYSRKLPLLPFFSSPNLAGIATLIVLLIFSSALAIFGYRQFNRDTRLTAAYPTSPVTPNRQLSFQGRLESAGGTPITTATNFVFKLFDAATLGSELYSTGTCSITPDQDGVFNTQIGSTCGSGIPSSVFSENSDVWLEVTVGAEILDPRQQIATVAYALNSETIQGFPISATVSAIRNTVVPMNQWGEIVIGEQSPKLIGVSGTLQVSAPSLSFTTTSGSNGDISIAPDGTGQLNITGNTNIVGTLNVDGQADLGDGTGTVTLSGTSITLAGFDCSTYANGGALTTNGSGVVSCSDDDSGVSSVAFTDLTSGTNTTAAMVVGTGATLDFSGSGTINASSLLGGTWASPGSIGSTTPGSGAFTSLSANGIVGLGDGGDAITLNGSSLTLTGFNCTTYANGGALTTNGSGVIQCSDDDGGGGGGSFTDLTSGTNTTAAMVVGTGATLDFSGSGTINASSLLGGTWASPGSIGSTTPGSGAFTSLSANGIVGLGDGGDAITLNGSSLTLTGFNCTTYANGGALTTNGSGVLGCSDDDRGIDSLWQDSMLGSISPLNSTWDVLIGGTATSSAKAGFININDGVPTATLSAGTSGGAYLTASGTLATTAKQDLNIGNSTTGNINIGVGSGDLYIGENGTSVDIRFAESGFIEADSGKVISMTDIGTILPDDNNLYNLGSDTLRWANVYANSFIQNGNLVCDASGANCPSGSRWTDGGSYLYPTDAEYLGNPSSGGANKLAGIYLGDTSPLVFGTDNDISFSFSGSTLGSTFTTGSRLGLNTTDALATLDVRSSLGTIPVASFSGETSMATLVVDQSGTGDIFTASKSGDTKFVITNAGNVGIGVSAPTNKLEIGGSTSTISNTAGDITIDAASDSISFSGDSLINILNIYASGEMGVGIADAIGRFHVHGAQIGKALVILNELGDQDLLTASASGTTRFRLTNLGSLSLDGDYLNFGLTDGTSGYGFRDNGGTLQFKHNGGSWADIGSGSGGGDWWDQALGVIQPYNKTVDLLLGSSATESAKIGLININSGTPTATLSAGTSGGLYITAAGKIATTAKQNLALGDATTTGNIILQGGNVGIGVASPTQKLEVNGYIVGQRFEDTSSSSFYLDPAASGVSLSIEGSIVSNGAFYLSTGSDAIAVSIGTTGAGKLDAGTIDPPYTINGEKFATYMASMIGVKEETTGSVYASEYIAGKGYRATLNFATALSGSDLWLFSKVTDLSSHLDKLVVLLSGAGDSQTWYEISAQSGELHLYSRLPTLISYRLTAPRFDADNWTNARDSDSLGFVIDNNSTWSVSDNISNFFSRVATNLSDTIFPSLSTDLISPLASGSAVTISRQPDVNPVLPPTAEDPILIIDGELSAERISARQAFLSEVVVDRITAREIVADSISANTIIGLDAKIASLSGISDSDLESITDRIKARLQSLRDPDETTAEDVPSPDNSDTVSQWYSDTPTASDSAVLTTTPLASADIDFATINHYLAVIGQATITSLDVTDNLYTTSIDSKTGILALGQNTLLVDASGSVAINGDLLVSGKILADSASLNSLEIGTPKDATSSALGNLLAIYNEAGEAVATIDASGSANLASLKTGMITITGAPSSTDSSALSSLIGSTQSDSTAGVSTLVSPGTEITINSPYITANPLIYLTPTGNTSNKVLFVKSKTSCATLESSSSLLSPCIPSFTVAIDSPALNDISFNWWIIELAQPKEIEL